jgi:nitrite reductase (NADH) small subunit
MNMIATTISLGSFVVNLGRLNKIPRGEGRVFQIGGRSIAVFHTRDSSVFATEPTCPHKGGPLADGLVGAQKVICPLHSFAFDLSSGAAVGSNCSALKTYPSTVSEEGDILVGIDDLLAAR